jgi:hypothetical protein
MSRPNGAFLPLYRHFLGQFFENDLVSPQGEFRTGLAGVLGLVATPGLIVPLILLDKYSTLIAFLRSHPVVNRDAATYPDKYLLLALALAVPALASVLKWESLFPDRKDHGVLVPMPLTIRELFLAKALALATFIALFAIAVNAASVFLFPLVVLGDTGTAGYAARYIGAHAVATLACSVFGAACVVAAEGVGITLLGGGRFRRISGTLQFVLLTLALAELMLAPRLGGVVHALVREGGAWHWALPPLWFLGLYEVLLGKTQAVWSQLAWMAGKAMLAALVVAGLAYVLSYPRHFRRIAETLETESARGWERIQRWVNGWAGGDARQRGVAWFTWWTLARSRVHRLLMGAFLGVATAQVLGGLAGGWLPGASSEREALWAALSAPVVVSFFLLVSVRFLFEIPAEQEANWIFRVTEDGANARRLSGATRALAVAAVAPSLIMVVGSSLAVLGFTEGLLFSVWCLALIFMFTETLLVGFRKLPFTCSFAAAKWNGSFALVIWWSILAVYTWVGTRLGVAAARSPALLITFGGGAAALALWLHLRRLREWRMGVTLQFRDGQAPAVQTLDLTE